ncbi:ras association domain-containing protein 10 [Plakobranchus ocellatus]|uniref:Ras association domain-containing protein 10 n=1 Tax=Plakobranchus ocellatus TaxID=259542 RepID=A0AAV3YWP3_9GAST|nr:ras association domain-containing protein 10 [Plakobranchus ocellatus]
MEYDDHEKDIPIWFNGTQRWMAGLTRRTTCDDVIYAILYSSGLHEAESTDNFAIFEKWREVERPLSSRTKILKVWAFWGEEQPNVSLTMRSLNDYFLPGESSLYMRSRRRHKRSNRQRTRHSSNCKCQDRRACGECSRLKSLEHLVKLVVSQERKMQDISDHILDTDRLIEKHEARIHEHRVQQNGLDYVQESYLNSYSSGSGSSSSLDSACLSVATLDLNEARRVFPECSLAELGEITRMCDQLTHLERRLAAEKTKAAELEPEVCRLRRDIGQEGKEEELQNAGLEEARVQLLRAVTTHVSHEYNERMLDRRMEACLADVEDRAAFLQALQSQLSEVESRLAYSTGNETVCSDSEMSGCSVDSNTSPAVTAQHNPHPQTSQDHKHTSHQNRLYSDNAQNTPMQTHGVSQNLNRSSERDRLETPKDNSENRKPGTMSQNQNVNRSPRSGKSLTGRGRFAKEHMRSGINPLTRSSVEQQNGERNATHAPEILRDKNRIIRSLPQTNESSPSHRTPTSSSPHHSLPNGVVSHGINSGGVMSKAKTDPAAGVVSNIGISQSPDHSHNGISQSDLDHNSHLKATSFLAKLKSKDSARFIRSDKSLRDSVVNSVGSCGDVSRLQAGSPTPVNQPFSREGRSRTGVRGGDRHNKQTTIYRRSRSADRDTPHAHAQRSRANAMRPLQSKEQHYQSEDNLDGERASDMEIINSYGLDAWSLSNRDQQIINKQNQTIIDKKNTDYSGNNRKQNQPSPPTNHYSIRLNENINSQRSGAEREYHNPSKNQNCGLSNKQKNDQICSPLLLNSKPGHEQSLKQNVAAKEQNRPTLIPQSSDQRQPRISVNTSKRGEGREDISAQKAFSLDASNNLRTKAKGVPGLEAQNDVVFAQRTAAYSQTIQPSASSSFHVDTQQPNKTAYFQNGTPSPPQVQLQNSNATSNKQELVSNARTPNSSENVKNLSSLELQKTYQIPADAIKEPNETNSSRGALYHIVSQKLNASKEKIRLNSSSNGNTNQQDQDIRRAAEKNGKNFQRGRLSNANSTQHVTNGNANIASRQNHHGQYEAAGVNGPEDGRSFPFVASTGNKQSHTPVCNGKSSADSNKPPISSRFNPSPIGNSRTFDRPFNDKENSQIETDMYGNELGTNNIVQPRYDHQLHHQNYDHQWYERNDHIQNSFNHNQNHQNQVNGHSYSQGGIIHQKNATESAPYRRSALNPHFCDVSVSGDSKPGTKYSARPPSNGQAKKYIFNGSIGLIDYRDSGIISDLPHNNGSYFPGPYNAPQSPFASHTAKRTSAIPTFTPFSNSEHLDVQEARKVKSKMEDSNDSDTGLSSMHSDETANMETLV